MSAFAPLPHPNTPEGDMRLTGVEIEFAGLSEEATARLIQSHLGGTMERDGHHAIRVTGTALGDITVELDTALRKWSDTAVLDAGLDALRGLIPVEIVTDPLNREQLIQLDEFRETLRVNGAIGTAEGLLLGFGVHLNVAVIGADARFTWRTVLAFALGEAWLRRQMSIDITRRVLPFVAPWPDAFVTELARNASDLSLNVVRDLYAQHCNSRNHALDLLPMLKDADPKEFDRLFPDQSNTKARPAFHFRLPDCRIDEADWSLDTEWRRWRRVEEIAATPDLLTGLIRARLEWAGTGGREARDWADIAEDYLGRPGNAALAN